MSTATPTVLPRSPLFPHLLPKPPQPHTTPLPRHDQRVGRFNSRRDLQREMDDLSDEEEEFDDIASELRSRGYNFLIPIGRLFTQHEEKNDASDNEGSDDSDESESSEESPSAMEDEENESAEEDLDADMDDMDAANATGETVDVSTDEYGQGSSEAGDEDEEEEEPSSDL